MSDENMTITIDGETYEVTEVHASTDYLSIIELDDGTNWYIAASSEEAGKAAAKYWRDMAHNDPAEFACIIGEERLVQWATGQSDSFGISSFDDFCDIAATVPEEHFGSYDESERDDLKLSDSLIEELGFESAVPEEIVAYRHN